MSAKVVRTTVSQRYDRFGQSTPAKTGVEFWLPASSWPAKTDVVLLPAADYDAMVEREREARRHLISMRAHLTESHGPEDYVCNACGEVSRDGSKHDEDCEVADCDLFLAETKGET